MSIKQRKATYRDVKLLNKMIKRTTEENYWIKYTKIPGSKWYISVFVDASLGALPGRTDSAFGFAVFLSDGYNPTERRTCVPRQYLVDTPETKEGHEPSNNVSNALKHKDMVKHENNDVKGN